MTPPFKLHDRVGWSDSAKQGLIIDREEHRLNDEGNITDLPGCWPELPDFYEVTFTNNAKTYVSQQGLVLLEPALPF